MITWNTDGQPLALDEIEKNMPVNSAKLLKESKWTFITQEVNFFNFSLVSSIRQ